MNQQRTWTQAALTWKSWKWKSREFMVNAWKFHVLLVERKSILETQDTKWWYVTGSFEHLLLVPLLVAKLERIILHILLKWICILSLVFSMFISFVALQPLSEDCQISHGNWGNCFLFVCNKLFIRNTRKYKSYVNTSEPEIEIRPKKKFRPIWDLNPWPLRYQCSALPTELTSQLGAGHYVGSK